jgi:ferredoxin
MNSDPDSKMRSPSRPDARREATRQFMEEAKRTPGFSRFDRIHGYVYARWPYLYIALATGEHRLSKWIRPIIKILAKLFTPAGKDGSGPPTVAENYHGKVLPLTAARQLVSVDEPIRLTDLEQIIPFPYAKDIILCNPDHIVVLDCPCRASRVNPCLPLDVCLVIGEPFASLVVEHHPHRSRWITSEEAQSILQAEHERGHVHHAFFKDAMLGRFYAICNCCPCCCGAFQAMRNDSPMLISSGYVCQVDRGLCLDCGTCDDVCPFDALYADDELRLVDDQKCMGCGVCVSACPEGALSLVLDPKKPAPLEIRSLMQQAAIH